MCWYHFVVVVVVAVFRVSVVAVVVLIVVVSVSTVTLSVVVVVPVDVEVVVPDVVVAGMSVVAVFLVNVVGGSGVVLHFKFPSAPYNSLQNSS